MMISNSQKISKNIKAGDINAMMTTGSFQQQQYQGYGQAQPHITNLDGAQPGLVVMSRGKTPQTINNNSKSLSHTQQQQK